MFTTILFVMKNDYIDINKDWNIDNSDFEELRRLVQIDWNLDRLDEISRGLMEDNSELWWQLLWMIENLKIQLNLEAEIQDKLQRFSEIDWFEITEYILTIRHSMNNVVVLGLYSPELIWKFLNEVESSLWEIEDIALEDIDKLRNNRETMSMWVESWMSDWYYLSLLLDPILKTRISMSSNAIDDIYWSEEVVVWRNTFFQRPYSELLDWNDEKMIEWITKLDELYWLSVLKALNLWNIHDLSKLTWVRLLNAIKMQIVYNIDESDPNYDWGLYWTKSMMDAISFGSIETVKLVNWQTVEVNELLESYVSTIKNFVDTQVVLDSAKNSIEWWVMRYFWAEEWLNLNYSSLEDVYEKWLNNMWAWDLVITLRMIFSIIPWIWDVVWWHDDIMIANSWIDYTWEKLWLASTTFNYFTWLLWITIVWWTVSDILKWPKLAKALLLIEKLFNRLSSPEFIAKLSKNEMFIKLIDNIDSLIPSISSLPWFERFKLALNMAEDVSWTVDSVNERFSRMFFSWFSDNIPFSLKHLNPKAWINTDWTISFNKSFLENNYWITISWDSWQTLFNWLTLRDFIRQNPEIWVQLMAELKNLKSHEVLHRLLDSSDIKSINVQWISFTQEELCLMLERNPQIDNAHWFTDELRQLVWKELSNLIWVDVVFEANAIRRLDTISLRSKYLNDDFRYEEQARASDLVVANPRYLEVVWQSNNIRERLRRTMDGALSVLWYNRVQLQRWTFQDMTDEKFFNVMDIRFWNTELSSMNDNPRLFKHMYYKIHHYMRFLSVSAMKENPSRVDWFFDNLQYINKFLSDNWDIVRRSSEFIWPMMKEEILAMRLRVKQFVTSLEWEISLTDDQRDIAKAFDSSVWSTIWNLNRAERQTSSTPDIDSKLYFLNYFPNLVQIWFWNWVDFLRKMISHWQFEKTFLLNLNAEWVKLYNENIISLTNFLKVNKNEFLRNSFYQWERYLELLDIIMDQTNDVQKLRWMDAVYWLRDQIRTLRQAIQWHMTDVINPIRDQVNKWLVEYDEIPWVLRQKYRETIAWDSSDLLRWSWPLEVLLGSNVEKWFESISEFAKTDMESIFASEWSMKDFLDNVTYIKRFLAMNEKFFLDSKNRFIIWKYSDVLKDLDLNIARARNFANQNWHTLFASQLNKRYSDVVTILRKYISNSEAIQAKAWI